MSGDRMPLNETRLCAIWETAKLRSVDRCEGVYHLSGCKCVKGSPLSAPAMELVEEIRRLRALCAETVKASTLAETPKGTRVLIHYEHFSRMAEVAKDDERGEDEW